MVKRYLASVMAVFVCLQQAEANKPDIPIKEQTFLVYRRYYFIERLDKTIQLLANMYHEVNHMHSMLSEQKVNFKELCPEQECKHIEHELIKSSISCIRQTRSLKPLFMVWDSFKSYKFLHDDLFVDDFSKEIFIITRNTINYLQRCQPSGRLKHSCMQHALSTYKLDELLDDIAIMTDHLCDCTQSQPNHSARGRLFDVSDLHLSIGTDEVAFRFYCMKRIERAVSFLITLPELELILPNGVEPVLRADPLAQEAHAHKSFAQLWEDVKQYKYIDDERFTRGFLAYTLALLLQKQECIMLQRSLTVEEVTTVYDQIEQMPIEELLNTIDLVVTNIHQMHQHYQQSGLTPTQWLQKYWWIPPLVFSSLLLKVIQHYYVQA